MSKLICIDPGHGGYDPGVVAGARESDFNLVVALDLKAELEKDGCRVVMTRTSDTALGNNEKADLQQRCKISDNSGADLFLSIHANAGGGNGAEAYCLSGGQGQIMAAELVECLKPVMGYHGTPVKDGSGLYVVKHTAAPAVLLEVGFMDSSDFKLLAANFHRFGALLAPPLIKFLGGSVTPAVNDKEKGLTMIREGLRLLGG
ncbi:MAG: N-acetylmuramoyl-L-alanine amidase [Bacteroidota bacterium]|nr:N-acetylmuramoyl-L-alanine amidase [Bacteroidota bacterium]